MTVLVWRNDGSAPFCEMLLDRGERIAVSLTAAGATIERLPDSHGPREMLVRASPDDIAWICATLGVGRPDEVLDVIVGIVERLGSAEQVREAFAAALAAMR
jgi:hypothetical protein